MKRFDLLQHQQINRFRVAQRFFLIEEKGEIDGRSRDSQKS
jgi:hypothetical protein